MTASRAALLAAVVALVAAAVAATATAPDRPVVAVAVMGPLTGPSSAYGMSQLQGAMLAADELNAVGRLPWRIRLLSADDAGDPALVGELARDLALRDDARAFVGCINSACTHVLEMLCVKLQRPQITCVSTDPTVTQAGSPWIFRCLADDVRQARALARHVLGSLAARRVALLSLDDRYGRQGALAFARELASAGAAPVVTETFPKGDADRAPLAARVADARPDVVVLWSLFREGAAVLRALRAAGVACPVAGPDGLTTPAFLEAAGAAAEGTVVTLPFNPERQAPETVAFLAAYRSRFSAEADSFAAHAYDAVHVLGEALRSAGPEPAALRDALARTAGHRGATGLIGFDRVGNDTREVELAVVRLGRFVPMTR